MFILVCDSYSGECVYARDTGNLFRIIVPAKPDLTISNGYTNNTTSQRAAWTDSKLYTNGDPFYFEIEGMWTPWSATYDLIGGDNQENKNAYAGLQQKQGDAFFCNIATKNEGIERFDRDGEFDYISSIMTVGNKPNYTKAYFANQDQKTCWLTAGEGLYIGFFGKTGNELPSLATHLKVANILCDEQYLVDLNNDGIKTINECLYNNKCLKDANCSESEKLNNTNMAYYTPGSVRCESDFYHKNKFLQSGVIGINDCYQDVEYANGIFREDKTIFIFSADYLYKNVLKETAKKNERIKFVIYDRYYGDNVGQYVINIYGGAQDNSDKGLIEKIVADLEDVFVGSRNEYGIFEGGAMMTLYNYLISDTEFALIVRLLIVFYMIFLGFSFAIGQLEYKAKELMNMLLKLTFILVFTSPTSWQMYNNFIVRFFYDGFMSIISMVGNLSAKLLQSENVVSSTSSSSMASAFYFIDNIVLSLFSQTTTAKILGLFFGVWYGFIVIPIIYILILYYIYQLINAVFPYIVMFIQAVFALFLGPIFIPTILFKKTENIFKGWLNFVGGRFANMIFSFTVIYVFWMIIKQQFDSLLFFNSCKVPLWQAVSSNHSGTTSSVANFFSLGINVWDANWDNLTPSKDIPGFFDMCFSLIFLFVMIYLFGIVMKKIPTIIDSMFTIDNAKKGGGLDFFGQSRFGNIGGLFDNLNKSIQIGTGEFKGGKERRVGITEFIKTKISSGATTIRKKALDENISKLKDWGKDKLKLEYFKMKQPSYLMNKEVLNAFPTILDGLENGTIDKDNALQKLNEVYEQSMKNKGFDDKTIEKEMVKFSANMERKLEDESVSMLDKYNREFFLERDVEKRYSKQYNKILENYDRINLSIDKEEQKEKISNINEILEKVKPTEGTIEEQIQNMFDNSIIFSSKQLHKLKNEFEKLSLNDDELSKLNKENIKLLKEIILKKNSKKIDKYNEIYNEYGLFDKNLSKRIEIEKNKLIKENKELSKEFKDEAQKQFSSASKELDKLSNEFDEFLKNNEKQIEILKAESKRKESLGEILKLEQEGKKQEKEEKEKELNELANKTIELIGNDDKTVEDLQKELRDNYEKFANSIAGIELPTGGEIALIDGGLKLMQGGNVIPEDGGIEFPGTLNYLAEDDKKDINNNYKEIQEKIKKFNEKMEEYTKAINEE